MQPAKVARLKAIVSLGPARATRSGERRPPWRTRQAPADLAPVGRPIQRDRFPPDGMVSASSVVQPSSRRFLMQFPFSPVSLTHK
jgi:hypothetical protein